MLVAFQVLQVIMALALIVLTAVTQTKSESSGSSGMGWGTIGGKSSSSIAGLEDQLGRLTMYAAIIFLVVSMTVGFLHI